MDDHSEGSLIRINHARHQKEKIIDKPLGHQVTIDILPEDVLLGVFDFYVAEADEDENFEKWQLLVHVCQKWRYVVFQSPLRLDLRILCSAETPVGDKLALWPPLPIVIKQSSPSTSKCVEDNIIAALGHDDRVYEIDLVIPDSLLETVFPAMRKTFVALKCLRLETMFDFDWTAPVVPDSFLGGSAPHLQRLRLGHIQLPFPILRNLLLSAPNLATLSLRSIPHSAHFSPEAIVTCLSTLTKLNHLTIGFVPPQTGLSWEDRHRIPTRSVLPALTELTFFGRSEYLADLVARIDAPLLSQLFIKFSPESILDTPRLVQFISRTPKFKTYDEACISLSDVGATIELRQRDNLWLRLGLSCPYLSFQLKFLAQLCTSSFTQVLIPMLDHLYIENKSPRPLNQANVDNNNWLELLRPFSTAKNLYLSREFAPYIMPTLQGLVGESVTEVLPNLQSIFLEDLEEPEFVPKSIRRFVAARQLSSRPIAISHWTR